ncbi:unnamed protein product [Linum tenue]|nr:unnamed protein product [Linum tenue]
MRSIHHHTNSKLRSLVSHRWSCEENRGLV